MPNRVIREGFLDSAKINSLSEKEQNFFVRLMLIVDDFGKFDARPEYVRSRCYPVADSRLTFVRQALDRLNEVGLIRLYQVDDKIYLQVTEFNKRTRIMKSTFQSPNTDDSQTSDNGQTDVRLNPIRNQSNPNTKPKGFAPPDRAQVFEYCKERQKGTDPDKWYDHYLSNGWMVGKSKMRDWKAAVRNWEKNDFGKPSNEPEVIEMSEEEAKEKGLM